MELKRNGSQPSIKSPEATFTGTVRIDPLFQSPGPAAFGGALVWRIRNSPNLGVRLNANFGFESTPATV